MDLDETVMAITFGGVGSVGESEREQPTAGPYTITDGERVRSE